jgi:Flp pilus assembly protein CpaB
MWRELPVNAAGLAHRSSQHVASDVLERRSLSSRDPNRIIGAKAASPPGKKELDTLITGGTRNVTTTVLEKTT